MLVCECMHPCSQRCGRMHPLVRGVGSLAQARIQRVGVRPRNCTADAQNSGAEVIYVILSLQGMKLWHHPRTFWGHRDAKGCMSSFQSGWPFFPIQPLKPSSFRLRPRQPTNCKGHLGEEPRWSLHGPFPQTWDQSLGWGGAGFSSSPFWSLSFTLIHSERACVGAGAADPPTSLFT